MGVRKQIKRASPQGQRSCEMEEFNCERGLGESGCLLLNVFHCKIPYKIFGLYY